jgi:tight adherence protein B
MLTLCLIFAAAFLMFQIAIGVMKQAGAKVVLPNQRLKLLAAGDPQTLVLERMRRKRGLDSDGQLGEFLKYLGKLILHSGLPVRVWMVPPAMVVVGLLSGLGIWFWKENTIMAGVASAVGFAFPIFMLSFLGKRRRNKAVQQLPEALDVIVRSLSAGHPVPVALNLVGREMPDPIGSEFGIAADEIGFGAGVATAIQRMAERIDHEDFSLFAAMIRLQERTGGNLAELLRANAKTIRDRQTMRLKIKAASAEGRMSALILNLAPIGVWLGVNTMAPDFYGEVEGHPWVTYGFWGVAAWMVIGNLVMRRMINFRI